MGGGLLYFEVRTHKVFGCTLVVYSLLVYRTLDPDGTVFYSSCSPFLLPSMKTASYRQAITAAADGAKAAIDAERWLRDHTTTRSSSFSSSAKSTVTANSERSSEAAANKDKGMGDGESKSNANSTGAATGAATALKCNNGSPTSSVACIKDTVAAHPVVVFSKKGCPYCRAALEALAAEGVTSPLVIDITGQ